MANAESNVGQPAEQPLSTTPQVGVKPSTPTSSQAAPAGVSSPGWSFPQGQAQQPPEQQPEQPMLSPTDLTPDDLALVWDMVNPPDEPSAVDIMLERLDLLRMNDDDFIGSYFDKYGED